MEQNDLFYCYSPKLKKFLTNTKNIRFLHQGINTSSNRSFWVFIRTDELGLALAEWTNTKPTAKN